MPFKSKAQQSFMFAAEARGELPKGTAKRWARHTPDMKNLPARVKKDEDTDKKAFAVAFVVKCAAAGVTDPEAVAALAEELASTVEADARIKAADWSSVLGQSVTWPMVAGTVGLPLVGGYALGRVGAAARNQADRDDASSLRLAAQANAYRRRAEEAKLQAQVRKLVESDPKNYVVLG